MLWVAQVIGFEVLLVLLIENCFGWCKCMWGMVLAGATLGCWPY
jgi:hypothetical protein